MFGVSVPFIMMVDARALQLVYRCVLSCEYPMDTSSVGVWSHSMVR